MCVKPRALWRRVGRSRFGRSGHCAGNPLGACQLEGGGQHDAALPGLDGEGAPGLAFVLAYDTPKRAASRCRRAGCWVVRVSYVPIVTTADSNVNGARCALGPSLA